MAITWRDGPRLPEARERTLAGLLGHAVERFGAEPVITDSGRTWSWAELDHAAARLASSWRGVVTPESHVAIVLPNGIAHLLAELATWRLGAVAVPIFHGLGIDRIRAHLHAVNPVLVVGDEPGLAAAEWSSAAVLRAAERSGQTLADWRSCQADDPCLVLFTSGSSGRPRGVVLTQDNLCSQQAAFAMLWPEVGPGDRLAAYLPWYHSFGALAERLWSLVRGAHLHVVPGGGRDKHELYATVRAVQPTVFMSVPRVHRLLHEAEALPLEHLRWSFTAGAALGAREEAWYAAAGVPVYEGWGLTETSPSATITPPGSARVPGVVGQPIPGVGVGVDEQGELYVRGPGVMAGYLDDPQATAAVLHDGVLTTGDVGHWQDDGLYLIGRRDHMVKVENGEKVHVAAIEQELAASDAIRHAVVIDHDGYLVALCEAGGDSQQVRSVIDGLNRREPVPYRRIMHAWLIEDELSIEGGQLTASHKVVRPAITAAFRQWLERGGSAFRELPHA